MRIQLLTQQLTCSLASESSMLSVRRSSICCRAFISTTRSYCVDCVCVHTHRDVHTHSHTHTHTHTHTATPAHTTCHTFTQFTCCRMLELVLRRLSLYAYTLTHISHANSLVTTAASLLYNKQTVFYRPLTFAVQSEPNPIRLGCVNNNRYFTTRGPIYKISYDLS